MALDLRRLVVLIVDDSSYMRTLLAGILYAMGISRVQEASSASEALAAIRAAPPDVVFVDWQMEPIDGMKLIQAIRQDGTSPNPFVPIIMITSETQKHRVESARDHGATEFLAKPITAQSVYGKLRTVVERPRQFVRVGNYFGPDRRRTVKEFMGGNRRDEN